MQLTGVGQCMECSSDDKYLDDLMILEHDDRAHNFSPESDISQKYLPR